MEKLILGVPVFHWLLCLCGFSVHILMKWGKAAKQNKVFLNKVTKISMTASLLMSAGMLMAFSSYFQGEKLLPFASLGAGYLNNSLWTYIMNAVSNKAKKTEEEG